MKRVLAAAGCAAVLAAGVCAQSFQVGPGGVSVGGIGAPAPGTPQALAQGPLDMTGLSTRAAPGDFVLLNSQSNRFGPYPYRDGAIVGSEKFPYTLKVQDAQTFSLLDPRQQGTLGPFHYETGTTIAFERATLALVRLPPQVFVSIAHSRSRSGSAPTLAATPVSPVIERSLIDLRVTLANLYNRLGAETGARSYEGLPRVTGLAGFRRDPTAIKPSLRDRENARRQAESTAGLAIERFQREAMPFKARPDGADGRHYRFDPLPAGTYVFCALWHVKDTDAITAAGAKLAVWWTTFTIEKRDSLALDLTEENAVEWTGVFKFPKLD